MTKRHVSGTKEWAEFSVNCRGGCTHGCLYCYARNNALRFGRIQTGHDWENERSRKGALVKRYVNYGGVVMFPTTHDITPKNFDDCYLVICKLLAAGNDLLIVSKPHLSCIDSLTSDLTAYRDQILFRFSIGMVSEHLRSFWEPHAPTIAERVNALSLAYRRGFKTSVSCEPLIESGRIFDLVGMVERFVTDSIWIGKANNVKARCAWNLPGDHPEIEKLLLGQTDEVVYRIFEALKHHPKIRWKDSYKKVLGLERPTKAGMDK